MELTFIFICIFILLKIVLFFFPYLIHKQRKSSFTLNFLRPGKFTVIAHRGGSFESLENTTQAVNKCLAKGVRFIEGDALLTKDEQLVMIHDPNLLRLTNKNVDLASLNYEELPFFATKIRVHFSKKRYYCERNNSKHKPQLLRKFFEEFKNENVHYVIELKSGKTKDVKMALELERAEYKTR